MNNFFEIQQLAFLSSLMSGECFALLPLVPRPHSVYDLRIRLVEADRCSSPGIGNDKGKGKDIKAGVEVDKDGSVLAYWFSNRHPLASGTGKMDWARIEAVGAETGRRN
ncbi:phage portal protein, partial [Bacillus mobilis]